MSPLKRREGPGPWALGSWWTLGPVPGERPRGTRTLPSGHARPPPAQRQGEKRTAILLSWAGPGRAAAPCSHSLFQLFPATASPNLLGLKPKSKSKQVPFGKFENSPVPFAAVQHSWGQRSQREAEGQWRKEANPLAATESTGCHRPAGPPGKLEWGRGAPCPHTPSRSSLSHSAGRRVRWPPGPLPEQRRASLPPRWILVLVPRRRGDPGPPPRPPPPAD